MAAQKKTGEKPASKKASKKSGAKPATGTRRRRRGVKLQPTALEASDLALASPPPEIESLAKEVVGDGGAVLATYREPLGGHPLLLVALPVERISPTPFQRDISDAHVRRLTHAMDKTKRFLDPIVVVREASHIDGHGEGAGASNEHPEVRYWTPNGFHRLTAMKELGARTVPALLVPERDVAYQILALNIEKAHNLREKAISVRRMYVDLAATVGTSEEELALELEEPALVTLGFAYEQRGRLSGGAYHPVLRKADRWIGGPLTKALAQRQARAQALLALDEGVTAAVDALKARGFSSPYLRSFVVARVNPLRFMKGEPPPVDELLASMTRRVRAMKLEKIRPEDVARTGGAPEPEAEVGA